MLVSFRGTRRGVIGAVTIGAAFSDARQATGRAMRLMLGLTSICGRALALALVLPKGDRTMPRSVLSALEKRWAAA
jgi:hypothetical protein